MEDSWASRATFPTSVKYTIVMGLLVRGQFRDFLEKMKFYGWKIEYTEQKGWLDSTFLIKSDRKAYDALKASVEKWNRDTGG